MEVAVCVVNHVSRTSPAYGPTLESAPPLITHAQRLRHTVPGAVCLVNDVTTYRTLEGTIAC